jgi:hypothetical protein
VIEGPAEPEPVTADPADDYLFALALSGRADLIVSGDRHLTEVTRPVVTPREFGNRLGARQIEPPGISQVARLAPGTHSRAQFAVSAEAGLA